MESPHLHQCVRAIENGGIVAYPTEGVWGLGCDPNNSAALQRLLELKQRPAGKGLILIAHEFSALEPYIAPLDKDKKERVLATWPGPVTWLWPVGSGVSPFLRGDHETIAVRVTAHAPAVQLCTGFGGAVVSTSANLTGRQPATEAHQVRRQLGHRVDALLPGPTGGLPGPTQIRDARNGRILRPAPE